MSTLPLISTVAEPLAATAAVRPVWQRWRAAISDRFGYALADQVVYSIGNMVVAAMLSRHAAERQFGIYILTQRAMDVLIQLCNVFLWGPFTFTLPSMGGERRKGYQGSILAFQVMACALFTFALWAASSWTATLSHPEFHAAFTPLIVASSSILFREFNRRMYFAQMRMREAFWTDVATVVLQCGGVYGLYVHARLSVPNTLYVLAAAAAIVNLWWLAKDLPQLQLRLRSTLDDLRLNLQLGRWFLGSNMVFMASSQCNPWVLGAVLGGSSVGVYAICESVVNIPRVALTSMQNVMGPALATAHANEGPAGVCALVKRMDRMLLAGSALCALCVCLSGPPVARLIFRSSPGNARLILCLLSLNFVAYACTLAQSYGLTALRRVDTTFYANALGLLVQAAVCLFFVGRFGVPGAALAMLLGNLVVMASRQVFYRRELARR